MDLYTNGRRWETCVSSDHPQELEHVLTLSVSQPDIWIGKDSMAKDLLVKRGKIYGDRHELPAAVGIRGGSEILPLMGIGDNVGFLGVSNARTLLTQRFS